MVEDVDEPDEVVEVVGARTGRAVVLVGAATDVDVVVGRCRRGRVVDVVAGATVVEVVEVVDVTG
jgi:hypothetical protein